MADVLVGSLRANNDEGLDCAVEVYEDRTADGPESHRSYRLAPAGSVLFRRSPGRYEDELGQAYTADESDTPAVDFGPYDGLVGGQEGAK
jgi:hypothetical protein